MADLRDAVVLDAATERAEAVAAELARHGHEVRVLDEVGDLLAATTSASLLAVGVHGEQELDLVRSLRTTPDGQDAVIIAIVGANVATIAELLRAGVSDVWPLEVGSSARLSAIDVRIELAKHYARLQVEHSRIGGELAVLKRALDLTGTGFVLTDPGLDDHPIVYANRSFGEMTGYPLDQTLGRNCRFLQGEGTDRDAVAKLARAIEDETSASTTLLNFRQDGTSFLNEIHISPVRDESGKVVRFVGVQVDVTGQQETGARLATERAARHRAEGERRRIAIVATATASMDRAETPDAVLKTLRSGVRDLVGTGAELGVDDDPPAHPERSWVVHGGDAEARDHTLVLDAALDDGDDRSAVALLVRRAEEALRRVGARTAERQLASAMRESLEPLHPVALDALDVVATIVPAGPGTAVGGDFVELLRFADGTDGLVLGDVTGQGPEAAALTGLVRHSVRSCARLSGGPADALRNVNRVLRDIRDKRRYSAVAIARIVPVGAGAWTVTVALAGSPRGVLVTADGTATASARVGTLLGASDDPVFEETEIPLTPGDAFALFSDGVSEHLGGGPEASDKLAAHLQGPRASARDLASAILGASAGDAPHRADDRAVVVVRAPADEAAPSAGG